MDAGRTCRRCMISLLIILLIFSATSLFKGGLFTKYPSPKYFSDEEEEKRPVYSSLSKKEKAVYEALYRGMCCNKKKIMLPYDISGDDYSKIFRIVEKQEGELFQLDSMYYTAKKVHEAQIIYRVEDDEIREMREEFNDEVDLCMLNISSGQSDYDKVMYIHDFLINKCEYKETDESGMCPTAYGCLVNEEANCEGYAKAFDVLCSKGGVKSVLITGQSEDGENHAWNQVCVDGCWYNIDVTWDDTDVYGDIRRTFFLCDDTEFNRTHIPDNELFEPFRCGNASGNYYKLTGHYAESVDDARAVLCSDFANGMTECEIKFADHDVYDDFKAEYIDGERVFEVVNDVAFYTDRFSISVRENRDEKLIKVKLDTY